MHELKLTNYIVLIKTEKQDLFDILNMKNTGLSDKNGVTNMTYILSTKVLAKNVVQYFFWWELIKIIIF